MANTNLKPTLAESVEVHWVNDQEGAIHILLGLGIYGRRDKRREIKGEVEGVRGEVEGGSEKKD